LTKNSGTFLSWEPSFRADSTSRGTWKVWQFPPKQSTKKEKGKRKRKRQRIED
jgi:hypothetical protein